MENIFKIFLLFSSYTYLAIFLILVLSGTGFFPVPEELTLLLAGFLIHQGIVKAPPMIIFCVLGIFFSDLLAFLFGHFYGERIKERKLVGQLFSFRSIIRVERYSKKLGSWIVLFGRFATGIRPLVFLFAGITRVNLLKFIMIDFIGSIISTSLWAGAGWLLGRHIEVMLIYFYRFNNFIIYTIILFFAIYFLDKYIVRLRGVNFFPVRKLHKFQLSMLIAVLLILLGAAWQTVSYRLYLIRYLPGANVSTLYTRSELNEVIKNVLITEEGAQRPTCPNIILSGRLVDIENSLKKSGWNRLNFFTESKSEHKKYLLNSEPSGVIFKSGGLPQTYLYLWDTRYYLGKKHIWIGYFPEKEILTELVGSLEENLRISRADINLKKGKPVYLCEIPFNAYIQLKAKEFEKFSVLNSTH